MTYAAVKHDNPSALKPEAEYRGKIYDGILQTIGATPLVRVPKFSEKYGLEAELLVKLEFFNPLSSVKDRIGYGMFEAAERAGEITPGVTTIIEPTSGNTGIALAFIGAAKGYRVLLTMPESMSIERRKMLRLYGAELVLTPAEKGMKGAIEKSKQLLDETANSYSFGQFDNAANPQIHSETTAEEIWNDTNGKVDILVSGVGTGGTVAGVTPVLKARKDSFRTYVVEPKDSPVIGGGEPGPHKIQGIGAGFIPSILDTSIIAGTVNVTNEQAFETAREIVRLEGIPAGISTGANLAAAVEVAKMPENKGKMIVTIACSNSERYLSTALFEGLEG